MNFRKFIEMISRDPEDEGFVDSGEGTFWGSMGAGVLPIAKDTGRMLVQLRGAVEQPGTYGVIGGAVPGKYKGDRQAIINFLKKELKEEAGYSGSVQLIDAYIFKKGRFQYFNFLGIVPREFDAYAMPGYEWEVEDYEWVSWEELIDLEPKHFGLEALISHSGQLIRNYAN